MRSPKPRPRGQGELHAKLILGALKKARRPASAYDIIAAIRHHVALAPQTVYRALDKLVEAGLVHKLESLNAYVPCCGDHHDLPTFAVCKRCGTVAEFDQPEIFGLLSSWSQRSGFSLESTTVELHGLCSSCRTKPSRA